MNNKKPVGLLWDSISNNTGDISIGMMMKRFCEMKQIPFEVLNPFSYQPNEYSTLIIGGGQILRASEDLYYQNFRVPGPHILNAVGIHHPNNLEYLNDYRLVSVRSEAEKKEIINKNPKIPVVVRPCVTIQFEDFFYTNLRDSGTLINNQTEWVGVHINNTTLRLLPNLVDTLISLNQKYRLIFIPFTHYQNDRYLMEVLSKWLPGSKVFPLNDPISIFSMIGGLSALITSSMHAGLFAYVQNVPVIAFPQDYKIQYFFEERGFPQCLYQSSELLPQKLNVILHNPPNYSESVRKDKKSVQEHFNQIEEIVRKPVLYQYNKKYIDIRYNSLQRAFYLSTLQNMMDLNSLETKVLDLSLLNQRLQSEKKETIQSKTTNMIYSPSGKYSLPLIKFRDFYRKIKAYLKYLDQKRIIMQSGLFDRSWYLLQYPDVAESRIDPLWHYLIAGGWEGRNPSPRFNSNFYLSTYEDAKMSGLNPLIHYLTIGKSEGRKMIDNQNKLV